MTITLAGFFSELRVKFMTTSKFNSTYSSVTIEQKTASTKK
ncbi:hypothetical protein PLUTE_a1919 [Pseudoalteromonas luteoviolacea DSM 6061]|nr:hypothetical protein [Pseudoalteromonas luteoviolacea DSM 6061]